MKSCKIRLGFKEIDKLRELLTEEDFRILIGNKVDKIIKNFIREQQKAEENKLRREAKNKAKFKELVEYAKEFRKGLIDNQTKSELVFKAKLKSINIKYEFQKIVYTDKSFYILDFYLPEHDLIIELDGGYHFNKDQRIKDKDRTLKLKELGYLNLKRLTNKQAIDISDLELKDLLYRYKK